MKPPKTRLDRLLVERGLAPSRERAQGLILAGRVLVGGQKVDKAGTPVGHEAHVEVLAPEHPWVSRGGIKLNKALDTFEIDPTGQTCLDVGASTGGFTDVLLQRGATHVTAVDVGYGQLAHKLRIDPRVAVLERENIRHLDPAKIATPPTLVVIDVSFIGLAKVLPKVIEVTADNADIVALVKPQFEVGPRDVGKGGIVRDEAARMRAVSEVSADAEKLGLTVAGRTTSPVKGAKGNVEFLLHLKKAATTV